MVLLDPTGVTKNNMKNLIDDIYKSEGLDKIYPITNAKYKKLLQQLKTKRDINDLWKINGIQNYTRWLFMYKHFNILKFNVPILSFVNMQKPEKEEWSKTFNNKTRMEDIKILKKHNKTTDNYKAIIFTNKTHYIFDKIQQAKASIKEINRML